MSIRDSLARLAADETAEPVGRFPADPDPIWRGTIAQLGSHSPPDLARETATAELNRLAHERVRCIKDMTPFPDPGHPPGSPPYPPTSQEKVKKSKKIKKISQKEGNMPENLTDFKEDTAFEDNGQTGLCRSRDLELVPIDNNIDQSGLRIISPRKPDGRLRKVALGAGMPPEATPLGFLLAQLQADPPESVNGAAILMWESIRQKAAIALLPYLHPRIATVEADESDGDHESALDALE